MDYADQLTNEIKLKRFLIELAKNDEISDILVDFSIRDGFVDLFDVANEPKYKHYSLEGGKIKIFQTEEAKGKGARRSKNTRCGIRWKSKEP